MDIPIFLSGNFAELRGSHFHGGIDIKTQGMEGKNILAAQSGFVSRIKIMPNGYGNVLYISHPAGYTTVYGHLKGFNEKISQYIEKEQYKQKSFAIELFPAPEDLPVQKGEIVAISGNSGSSGGPHLHFEIRDSKTENTLNPLLFTFPVADEVKPKIKSIAIYPLNSDSYVNGSSKPLIIPVTGAVGIYKLATEKEIEVFGQIGFGIDAVDYLSGSSNECGVFSIELSIDDQRIFLSKADNLPFSQTRLILSHIDFRERQLSGKDIQKTFVQPGNNLSFYRELVNRGRLDFSDQLNHSVKFTIKDSYLNSCSLSFDLRCRKPEKTSPKPVALPYEKLFRYNEANVYNTPDIKIAVPQGALYEDLPFRYKKSDRIKGTYSALHTLGSTEIPLNQYISIAIRPNNLPEKWQAKALIVSVSGGPSKYSFSSAGGSWKEGMVSGRIRNFGKYAIAIDSLPPTIKPVNVVKGKKVNPEGSLRFTIGDNLSGIGTFNGYIDGNWVLFNYDEKNRLIWHELKGGTSFGPGEHVLKLEVKDNKANAATWEGKISW